MKRIALMIIGAQKAGTSSLSKYLSEHPRLVEPLCLEFTWFSNIKEQRVGLDVHMAKFFPGPHTGNELFIAKMSDLYCSVEGLHKLYEHNPECKLLMVVRDPVQRAYSAYRMACFDGWLDFKPGFFRDMLLRDDKEDELFKLFLGYGIYAERLRSVYSIFPKDQIEVYRFEDLKHDPQRICNEVFHSLGLENIALRSIERVFNETRKARSPYVAAAINWIRKESNPIKRTIRGLLPYPLYLRVAAGVQGLNRSGAGFPSIDPESKQLLADFYREKDHDLEMLTGLDLSGWTSQRGSVVEGNVILKDVSPPSH